MKRRILPTLVGRGRHFFILNLVQACRKFIMIAERQGCELDYEAIRATYFAGLIERAGLPDIDNLPEKQKRKALIDARESVEYIPPWKRIVIETLLAFNEEDQNRDPNDPFRFTKQMTDKAHMGSSALVFGGPHGIEDVDTWELFRNSIKHFVWDRGGVEGKGSPRERDNERAKNDAREFAKLIKDLQAKGLDAKYATTWLKCLETIVVTPNLHDRYLSQNESLRPMIKADELAAKSKIISSEHASKGKVLRSMDKSAPYERIMFFTQTLADILNDEKIQPEVLNSANRIASITRLMLDSDYPKVLEDRPRPADKVIVPMATLLLDAVNSNFDPNNLDDNNRITMQLVSFLMRNYVDMTNKDDLLGLLKSFRLTTKDGIIIKERMLAGITSMIEIGADLDETELWRRIQIVSETVIPNMLLHFMQMDMPDLIFQRQDYIKLGLNHFFNKHRQSANTIIRPPNYHKTVNLYNTLPAEECDFQDPDNVRHYLFMSGCVHCEDKNVNSELLDRDHNPMSNKTRRELFPQIHTYEIIKQGDVLIIMSTSSNPPTSSHTANMVAVMQRITPEFLVASKIVSPDFKGKVVFMVEVNNNPNKPELVATYPHRTMLTHATIRAVDVHGRNIIMAPSIETDAGVITQMFKGSTKKRIEKHMDFLSEQDRNPSCVIRMCGEEKLGPDGVYTRDMENGFVTLNNMPHIINLETTYDQHWGNAPERIRIILRNHDNYLVVPSPTVDHATQIRSAIRMAPETKRVYVHPAVHDYVK